MNTMTLISDYVDALLDDGPLLLARVGDMASDDGPLDGLPRDGKPHDHRPAAFEAPAQVPEVDVTEVDEPKVDAPEVDKPEVEDATMPAFNPAPMPVPAPPPAFVPAIVPTAPAPPAVSPRAPAPTITSMATSHRWIRVTVGPDSYALELLRVQEVVRVAPIVALRGAARAVLGVMNLRGRIVPVLDLGLWLKAGSVHSDERSRIVVVERDDEMIGVLVSTVEDVVDLGRDRIEPPLASRHAGATVGIARVGPVPTVLLDATALFG